MFYIYKLCLFVADILPINFSFFLATVLGNLWYLFSRYKKTILFNNIKEIIKTDKKNINNICRKIFINYAKYFLEFFLLNKKWSSKAVITRLFINTRGEELLHKVINNKIPTILITAHIGNWDIGAAYICSLMKIKGYVMVEKLKDKKIFELYKKIREKHNMIPIEAGVEGSSRLIRIIKEGGIILLPADKVISGVSNTEMVEIFDKKVILPSGYVRLLRMNKNAKLLAGCAIRQEANKFALLIEEININNNFNIMQEIAKVLQNYIKNNIEQWYMLQVFFSSP